MQAYLATLEGLAPASRANATAAVKLLLTFAQETGYVRFNVGTVKAPPVKTHSRPAFCPSPTCCA